MELTTKLLQLHILVITRSSWSLMLSQKMLKCFGRCRTTWQTCEFIEISGTISRMELVFCFQFPKLCSCFFSYFNSIFRKVCPLETYFLH